MLALDPVLLHELENSPFAGAAGGVAVGAFSPVLTVGQFRKGAPPFLVMNITAHGCRKSSYIITVSRADTGLQA